MRACSGHGPPQRPQHCEHFSCIQVCLVCRSGLRQVQSRAASGTTAHRPAMQGDSRGSIRNDCKRKSILLSEPGHPKKDLHDGLGSKRLTEQQFLKPLLRDLFNVFNAFTSLSRCLAEAVLLDELIRLGTDDVEHLHVHLFSVNGHPKAATIAFRWCSNDPFYLGQGPSRMTFI